MKNTLAVALAMISGSSFAADQYTYQVGKVGDLKIWVVDFTGSGDISDAALEWESKNPQSALAFCRREWQSVTKRSSGHHTMRYTCQVVEK